VKFKAFLWLLLANIAAPLVGIAVFALVQGF
jgi:hypothetical protein